MKRNLLFLLLPTLSLAQGPLAPPGAPAPTQKSLQEILDKIGTLQTQISLLQTQNTALQTQLSSVSGMDAISAAGLALPWYLTTVDSDVNVGEFTSLAFGPDGHPAISYHDETKGDLKFARSNGSTWTTVTVDSAGDVGHYPSLAFGPDGHPAISYWDSGKADLKFTRFNGSTWTSATLDSAGDVGVLTSLAFGPDGQPAISYYDGPNGDLKFARKGLFKPAP